eukprot:CAMPEP_0185573192 /NCGR_PEP_ID=MMETSP0434-20130131/4966_1 /TAXON_ID=626734 ORGANISM="Favella taraikaensis, Strain Fe Narragansett Bay" /NCGR_SAMPLE_ID=MMETSP0434 /ASSEMBLY_ACC=CAM_ASM_000379 /LENGTH=69 /DNA_ID=CAMNT_0028189345 /DNA_START=1028 /DNA_END=1237 /DNA_ORIENTATION=-
MDDKGYMVFKDVTSWEEVEDEKPAKRPAAKTMGVKADSPAVAAGQKKGATQKKGAPRVQSALQSFFKAK